MNCGYRVYTLYEVELIFFCHYDRDGVWILIAISFFFTILFHRFLPSSVWEDIKNMGEGVQNISSSLRFV